jgi:hypothetical protein
MVSLTDPYGRNLQRKIIGAIVSLNLNAANICTLAGKICWIKNLFYLYRQV